MTHLRDFFSSLGRFTCHIENFDVTFLKGDMMGRQARKRSKTGIYHVLLRGIDKRDIFLDDEDRKTFIKHLILAKEKGNFELYAYCLMDNHVHLLIKEDEEIGKSIKRITVGYVGWHNKKYERTGHLFQNRFKSEPVETEDYLITVLRYIHQNPVKARMVKNPGEYLWCTYNQYINDYQNQHSLIDAELIKAYLKNEAEFIDYMNTTNNDECLESNTTTKYNNDTFKKVIQKKYNIDNLNDFPIRERNEIINKIYKEQDISIRQLSNALGLSKAMVERAVKGDR